MRLILFLSFILLWPVTSLQASDVAAIKSAAKKNYTTATSSKIGADLVTWYRLRQSDRVDFVEASQFVNTHPDWPDLFTIRKKTENAIASTTSSKDILTWFHAHPPATVNGMNIYLATLINNGQTERALKTLKEWWPKALLTPQEQADIIALYGKYLGSQDYERRMNTIIHDGQYTACRDLAKLLGQGYRNLVEAKIALIEQKPNVNQLVAAVPANLQNNEALMLARIQWRRKNNEDVGAIAMLNQAPKAANMADPEAWWQERHIMARRLMEQGKWGSAYQLVSQHRQVEGLPLAQAEFLAGWLALRKIGKPWEGFQHFEKLFNNVETPISRSRGAYWAGLASDTLGYPDIATQWYQVAANYQTTFYGQMAAQRINLPFGELKQTQFNITPQAQSKFSHDPLIMAATLLKQADQNYDSKQFFTAFIERSSKLSGLDYKLSADLADNFGYKETAIRIAKKAEKYGYLMPDYLFPVVSRAVKTGMPIHPAFAHGIMRQESAFDQYAQSSTGALGLMQLMPATAKETAHKAGLAYSQNLLTSDPAYNMTLGSLYMQQMLNRFNGNRTLAIAAYNAGPGRVSGWLKDIGDPRDPTVDEVDWIESIPVYETRNYVQRVTEAINVYARLIP